MELAEPEKVLTCVVNMRQLGYLPAADPDKVEVKTDMAYELNALEHCICNYFHLHYALCVEVGSSDHGVER